MLAEQRRQKILGLLEGAGSVSVNGLSRQLEVSRETIRRDITRLARESRLRKTHGGALSLDQDGQAFPGPVEVNSKGKQAIGMEAAVMVPHGASVIIDSATTAFCLAEALGSHRGLSVYTNGIQIAGRLSGRNNNKVLLLGGELQGREGATLGRDATQMLANYYADFAFIGVRALSAELWLMDHSREAAELRADMLAQARVAVLLADNSSFNQTASVRVANLENASVLITDKAPDPKTAEALAKLEIELVVALAR